MRSYESWIRPLQLLSCLILASCESANNTPSPDFDKRDLIAPTVFEVSPSASTILEPGSSIRVTFSERVDNDSVINGGILFYQGTLSTNDNVPDELLLDINVTKEADALVSILDPVTELPVDILASVYSVRLKNGNFPLGETFVLRASNSIKDFSKQESTDPVTGDLVAGNFLSTIDLELTVESGDWREAQTHEFGLDIIDFSIASSINENALIAWTEFDAVDASVKLWSGFYRAHTNVWFDTPSSDMVLALPLEIRASSDAEGDILQIDLSSNSDGKAAVTWVQTSTLTNVNAVWMSYFDGAEWSSNAILVSESVPPEVEFASSPSSKILANGDVVISWVESSAGLTKVKARTFSIQNGFTAETVFEPAGAINAIDPVMATNGDDVVLVWLQSVGGAQRIYSSAYFSVTGWDLPAQPIQTNITIGDASSLSVDMNSDGDGFAVWSEFDGVLTNIWRSRYASKTWAAPVLVEEDSRGDAFNPIINMGSRDGEAQVIWLQTVGSLNQVREAHFSLTDGWSSNLSVISTLSALNSPKVASVFDGYSNVTAFWTVSGNKNASRYSSAESDWKGGGVASASQGDALEPRLLPIALDGRILATWRELVDGNYRLTTSLYDSIFDE